MGQLPRRFIYGAASERYVVTLDPENNDNMGCKVESRKPINHLEPSTNKTVNPPCMNELFSNLNNTPNFPFDMKKNQKISTKKGKGKVEELDMILVDRILQD